MAVPGHDKGRSVYREALSLTEHGQNAKALFLLNQLSDSLSMLHSGVSEQKLLMDVNGLKAKNYMALGDMDKALRLYRDVVLRCSAMRFSVYITRRGNIPMRKICCCVRLR